MILRKEERTAADGGEAPQRVTEAAELSACRSRLEEQLSARLAQLTAQTRDPKRVNEGIIALLGEMVEARSAESGEHVRRVKGFTRILAEELMQSSPQYALNAHRVDVIVAAGALHDVGKLLIPDRILLKAGRLTEAEFELMKTHSVRGCEIVDRVRDLCDPEHYRTIREICRCHHEKVDGRGYPDGLRGDEIPVSAQLVSMADCYDALVTRRVYKAAFSPEKAYRMLVGGECGAFSDELLGCLTRCRGKMEALAASETGPSERAPGNESAARS